MKKLIELLPALVLLVLGFGGTVAYWNHTVGSTMGQATVLTREDYDIGFAGTREKLEAALDRVYDSLRLIAALPQENAGEYGTGGFEGSLGGLVRPIFGNLASDISVERIYIYSEGEAAGRGGKVLELRSGGVTTGWGESTGEVERVVKGQLAQMRARYPRRPGGGGLEWPAISSMVELARDERGKAGGRSAKAGLVYSVPFYSADGSLEGMISAVMEAGMLEGLLEDAHHIFIKGSDGAVISKPGAAAAVGRGWEELARGARPEGYPYSRMERAKVVDVEPWVVAGAVPAEEFYRGDDFVAARAHCRTALVGGLAATVLMSAVVWLLASSRARAVALAKSMTASLEGAMHAAERASEAKSEFLANMSHEIRTPMTAILGYADMLVWAERTHSDPREFIRTIQEQGEHLLEVINRVLDLSKIESGKLVMEVRATDPRAIVRDVVSLMRAAAREKGVRLREQFEGKIPAEIRTDPTQLRQALMNLVGNAIKFSDGGAVDVAVRLVKEERSDSGLMEFAVVDSGIGIGEEEMAHIFEPFEQADSSMTRRFGGTGLGLTISRRIAQMLGGDITVQSRLGVGSRFVLTVGTGRLDGVEMTEGETPAKARVKEKRPETLLSGRVLLVEDGVHNQRVISFYLEEAGLEVALAENGLAACEAALGAMGTGEAFDLVVMDMQMPVLDGCGAARRLRESGFSAPIIALTAHAMSADRTKCLESGCTDYLSKPVDRRVLIQKIGEHLGAGRTQREGAARADGLEGMMKFLPMFVREMPAMVVDMKRLAKHGDWRELSRTMHQVKGAAGMYGLEDVGERAGSIERMISDGRATEAVLGELERLVGQMRGIEGYDLLMEQELQAAAEAREVIA